MTSLFSTHTIVPREPSDAMVEASNREWDGRMSYRSSGAYQAVTAARPQSCRDLELAIEKLVEVTHHYIEVTPNKVPVAYDELKLAYHALQSALAKVTS